MGTSRRCAGCALSTQRLPSTDTCTKHATASNAPACQRRDSTDIVTQRPQGAQGSQRAHASASHHREMAEGWPPPPPPPPPRIPFHTSKSASQSTAARPAQRHVALVSSRTEVQYSPLSSSKVEHRERGGAALNPVLLRHVARDLDGHDEVGRVARGREHAEARRRLVHGAKVEAALGPLAVGDG